MIILIEQLQQRIFESVCWTVSLWHETCQYQFCPRLKDGAGIFDIFFTSTCMLRFSRQDVNSGQDVFRVLRLHFILVDLRLIVTLCPLIDPLSDRFPFSAQAFIRMIKLER